MHLLSLLALLAGCSGASDKDTADSGDSGDSHADTGDTSESGDTADTDSGDTADTDSGDTDSGDTDSADTDTADTDVDTGPDTDSGSTVDTDGDGTVDSADCGPTDPSIHPGAPELCDDVDQDCDGDVADPDATDAPTWYADVDGDGYGDSTAATRACSAPAGTVADTTDCDDTNASVHPGAPEVCDSASVDEDCDGGINDGDPQGATDAPTWYRDNDADGYGDPTASYRSCTAPARYVADDQDCLDTSASVHPGSYELCSTTYDDDCDGSTNDPGAVGCTAFGTDADGDGWGTDPSACLCEAEGGYSGAVGDCDDGSATVHPTAVEVCDDGVDSDCADGDACVTTDLSSVVLGASFASMGAAISTAGDWDGDGTADLAVGAPYDASGRGAVYAFTGPVTGTGTLFAALAPASTSASIGTVLDGGDLDDDGFDDLLVAAPGDDTAGTDAGVVYLQSGPLSSRTVTSATASLSGTSPAGLGAALASGEDWTGDGADDVLVWSRPDVSGSYLGFAGPLSGAYDAADAAFEIPMGGGYETDTPAVAALGDLNGDGAADFAVGGDYSGRIGSVGVFTGPISGRVGYGTADTIIRGTSSGAYTGGRIAGLGDVDADGYDDLAFSGRTGTWLFLGPVTATSISAADATYTGGTLTDGLGALVAADMTGDGTPELVIGSGANADGKGEVAIYGTPLSGSHALTDALQVWVGASADAALGASLAPAGDVDGDGRDDLFLGAPGDTTGGTGAGAVYLLTGALVP